MSSLKSARVVLAAATAALFAGVSVASAQARLEITPFAGYYIASDLYNAYSTTGNSNVELTNSGLWGVKLSATGFRGGIEFSYTRTGSDVHVDRTLSGQPRQEFGRVDIDSYDINFLGYQPSGNPRVTPIGIVGFGWSVTHPQIDTDFNLGTGPQPESHTLFNFNFGLGVKVAMSERLSTRIEGRWRVTDTHLTTDSGFWCDPWGYCYNYSSDWYNSGELLAGFSFAIR
ncbi:MAG TPA: outer membrane beta-barrel protein [Candidatus Eisenbacteria bacterium]|nr:outer membrane beta-barrel protein [Candidatus Eisenbacteria bacterium]